jgi:hypothetical protein
MASFILPISRPGGAPQNVSTPTPARSFGGVLGTIFGVAQNALVLTTQAFNVKNFITGSQRRPYSSPAPPPSAGSPSSIQNTPSSPTTSWLSGSMFAGNTNWLVLGGLALLFGIFVLGGFHRR